MRDLVSNHQVKSSDRERCGMSTSGSTCAHGQASHTHTHTWGGRGRAVVWMWNIPREPCVLNLHTAVFCSEAVERFVHETQLEEVGYQKHYLGRFYPAPSFCHALGIPGPLGCGELTSSSSSSATMILSRST